MSNDIFGTEVAPADVQAAAAAYSLWTDAAMPKTISVKDRISTVLGGKFRSSTAGLMAGIRFYKGWQNIGTHVGSRWSATGTKRATILGPGASGSPSPEVANPTGPPIETPKPENGGGGGTLPTATPAVPTTAIAPTQTQAVTADLQAAATNSLWSDTTTPAVASVTDARASQRGVKFRANTDGLITGLRFYKGAQNTGTHVGSLWTSTGTNLGNVTFTNETASGWQTATFANPVAIQANTTYVAAYLAPAGHWARTNNYFSADFTNGPLTALANSTSGGNGVFALNATASTFPTKSSAGANNWVDVVFQPSQPPSGNAIVQENAKPGSPRSEWDISGGGNTNIQGFATDMSVNRGATINFKINTNSTNYRIDIYRLGYYGGMGARKIDTIQRNLTQAQVQPNPLTDPTTGLIDAGNWAVSASWQAPTDIPSGVFIAKLVRQDGVTGANHIPFIVRDDGATKSDILMETSDTTWQAYNPWGGNSLYTGSPGVNPGRAYKVSYNRPFINRGSTGITGPRDFLFDSDYPMLRWMEANGYNVSYISGMDTDRLANPISGHKVFMTVGHDEYWSGNQRAKVEQARDAGVNLAFFAGNDIFWKTRWENSISASGTPYRTLVTYKETHANAKIDPNPAWTGTWRDPRFSPPADGGRPENALTGTIFTVNDGSVDRIRVPAEDGKMRFWRNTNIANLAPGQSTTLTANALTYEWNEDLDNGFRPAGLFHLSSTFDPSTSYLQDFGHTYGPGSATHSMTMYRAPSGALVFSAATPRWAWGLDPTHDTNQGGSNPLSTDDRMKQATVNLLADMGVQAGSLQPGLVQTTASTDHTKPTSAITAPSSGASLTVGTAVAINGTASDVGGVVGGVEVSVDGGTSWHMAAGRSNWTYNWTPQAAGSVTLKSRSVDDSGNLETPGSGRVVSVQGGGPSGATIFSASSTPQTLSDADSKSVELGVKFQASTAGTISGIRFYKGSQNTGTHTGSLWSSTGTKLASATFTNETASGWQQANFSSPVSIAAGTTYVASYHAPVGKYSANQNGFATAVTNGPLTAPSSSSSGGNGVYAYGAASAFPTNSFNATNYWVDVVFNSATG